MTKNLPKSNHKEKQMTANISEEFPQDLFFFKESTKEQILMSDNQKVHVFYSIKKTNLEIERPSIVFIQGLGPGIYSWSDFWDQLYKDYNLIVIDSREKPSIDLKSDKKCTVSRIALDIAEVLHHLKIQKEKSVIIASSFGIFYVAHCVANSWFKPRGCIFIGPFVESNYPKLKTRFAFMLPTFFLEKFGKLIARRFLSGKIAEGFQKKVYYERVSAIDVRRWKKCSKMRFWNATEDFKKIECPVMIYTTADDKYHKQEGAALVKKLIKNSKLEIIPNYNYMHIKPGVSKFMLKIQKVISDF